jgi:S1-C subfamily serine protease
MVKIFITALLLLPSFSFAAKTHTQIADEFGDTIVSVNVAKKDGSTHSGTGFIVHPSGIIATAGHVVENAIFINLTFKNGAISDEAVVVTITPDKEIDLALLQIAANNLPHVIFKSSDTVKAGAEITVIGNPRRLQNTITNGLISQLRQVSKGVVWQQISAPISPSSSGSPVFNTNGFVIGIALSSLKGSDNQNLNFAIPSNYLMELMRESGVTPDIDNKRYADISQGKLKNTNALDKIISHVKKSWYILKVKILKMKS